jgi:hypothetical protein
VDRAGVVDHGGTRPHADDRAEDQRRRRVHDLYRLCPLGLFVAVNRVDFAMFYGLTGLRFPVS